MRHIWSAGRWAWLRVRRRWVRGGLAGHAGLFHCFEDLALTLCGEGWEQRCVQEGVSTAGLPAALASLAQGWPLGTWVRGGSQHSLMRGAHAT